MGLELRQVEGFEGRYLVSRCGVVISLCGDEPIQKTTFPGPLGPRVTLYRGGVRAYRPYVHVLVRKAFGTEDLKEYVRDEYGDHPEVREWMAEAFAV